MTGTDGDSNKQIDQAASNGKQGVSQDARAMMSFEAEKKSAGVAYVLWFFLGGFGGHRFYLGQTGSAVALLVISILSWLTIVVGVGIAGLVVVGIWVLVDAFLIPGLVREFNQRLASRLG